jgi:dGTPase
MLHNLHPCGVFGESERELSVRAFPAPPSDDRTPFERDRDRVIQARAFRRLAGKTQVFTSRASDHFRSRLTHTMEVAQVARHVASALNLNVDLAETLALVHDIGHPPFGHAGERALDDCLQRHGLRFDHNLHALRIVERFEQRYAGHRGLNLTLATREGIIKHSRDYTSEEHPELSEYFLGQRPISPQIWTTASSPDCSKLVTFENTLASFDAATSPWNAPILTSKRSTSSMTLCKPCRRS